MNFFSMLNQVQAAEARNSVNAKTEAFKVPVVEPVEEETPVPKPKKQTKQKPAEGSGAENIEQKETLAVEEIKTDTEEE